MAIAECAGGRWELEANDRLQPSLVFFGGQSAARAGERAGVGGVLRSRKRRFQTGVRLRLAGTIHLVFPPFPSPLASPSLCCVRLARLRRVALLNSGLVSYPVCSATDDLTTNVEPR